MNREQRTMNYELLPAIRVAGQTKNGFSLMEVLLAIGILSIGMIFIAGVFPAAIYMTTVSTEQSIAAAAADEAFAKIILYDVNDWTDPGFTAGQMVPAEKIIKKMNSYEFLYPSIGANLNDKQYCWSALCRWINPATSDRSIQVTVFVCRKISSSLSWRLPDKVGVSKINNNVLQIEAGKEAWINDGYTIVDNLTGHIYRVLERDSNIQNRIILDKQWQGAISAVWVVPSPSGGGRYPCVAVYQKVIRF
jgi:prepilin-type N-terminal cleavage/methylation domain-containing protein